ncbi:MAG: DpnD/PcfM family protein [Synergistaceae bacterium]|nr:DpnD/PcfM family protein [Synergistaceae bacterium]
MKYKVKIVEKLSMAVEVEASSSEEAVSQVEKKYGDGEIIVESSNGPEVKFIVSPIEKK